MKKWYMSKTIWLGVVTVLVAAGDAFLAGGDTQTIITAVIGAAIVILRPISTSRLTK